MAKATVKEVVVEPAHYVAAVKEKTVTLTLTEDEAAGLVALVGRAQSQEEHPNSIYSTYVALHAVIPYDKRPTVVVDEHRSIRFR